MIDLHSLRIGDRVTMRYPNGILQEAVLVGDDAGALTCQFGVSVRDCVAPVVDIFLNGSGEWSVSPQYGTVVFCPFSTPCGKDWKFWRGRRDSNPRPLP
jgi:hypothetical protein